MGIPNRVKIPKSEVMSKFVKKEFLLSPHFGVLPTLTLTVLTGIFKETVSGPSLFIFLQIGALDEKLD